MTRVMVVMLVSSFLFASGCLMREDPEARLALAEEALLAGDLEEAKERYLVIAASGSDQRGRAINNLGLIAAREGNRATAEERFRASMAAYPDDPLPALNLAYLLHAGGRHEEAIAVLRKIVLANESFSEAYNLLGLVSLALKDKEGATTAFSKAVETDPENHRALNNLAYLALLTDNQGKDPFGLVAEALAADPGNPWYLDTLGLYHFMTGDLGAAQQRFNDAVKNGPEIWEIRQHYALLLEWKNLPEQARPEWEMVKARATSEEARLEAERHLWNLKVQLAAQSN
jgi:Flp pilus assembly protein TadD